MDLLTPSFGLIFWTLLAFIIVFLILKKYAWKPILKSLDERQRNISGSLETAERIKAEMAQLQSENEAQSLQQWCREERLAWNDALSRDPLLPERLLPSNYRGCNSWERRLQVLAKVGRRIRGFHGPED